jgi:hypothetical protein
MHIIVQYDDPPHESIVTYVRVWDPRIEEQVVLCRRCSKEQGVIPGKRQPEYIQPCQQPNLSLQEPKAPRRDSLWHSIRRCGASLFALVLRRWSRRKPAHNTTSAKPYSRTET